MCNVQVMKQVDGQPMGVFSTEDKAAVCQPDKGVQSAKEYRQTWCWRRSTALSWHYTEVNGGIDEEQKQRRALRRCIYAGA